MAEELERRVAHLYAGTPYDRADPIDAFALIRYHLGRNGFAWDESVPDVAIEPNRGSYVIRVSRNHPAHVLHWWAARGFAAVDLLRRDQAMSPAWADAYARVILLPGPSVRRYYMGGYTPEAVALERVIPVDAVKHRYSEHAARGDSGVFRLDLGLLPILAGNTEAT